MTENPFITHDGTTIRRSSIRFMVTFNGPIGIRSCIYEASSEEAVRHRWAVMWPSHAIISVEPVKPF